MPIARGGEDSADNWVCTSMLKNQAKSGWTLEELDWELYPRGSLSDWDGLTDWFCAYVAARPDVLGDPYLKRWHRAAERALETLR